jgi:hypothetical protein
MNAAAQTTGTAEGLGREKTPGLLRTIDRPPKDQMLVRSRNQRNASAPNRVEPHRVQKSFYRMRHVAPVIAFADRARRRLRKRIETAMRLSGVVPHMSAHGADVIGVTQPEDHRSFI